MPGQLGPRPHHRWWREGLFASGVALAIAFIIATDGRATTAEPYLFAFVIGACLLLPPRPPGMIMMVTVVLVFTYYARDNPPIGTAVPVAAALFTTARSGLLAIAAAGAGVVLLTSIWFRWHEGGQLGFLVGYEGVTNGALMAAALLLGESVRARRVNAVQADTIRALEAERLRLAAAARLESERIAVARDLHDIVGHALSVISIQTAVASEHLPDDAHTARSAMGLARSAAVESMAELRGLLRQLRTDGEATTEVASLSNLEVLLDRVRRGGIDVRLRLDPRAPPPPRSVDVTAYRVIQEALTNVTKHAHATQVDVTVDLQAGRAEIIVEDNGTGARPGATSGHGLTGMSERVRLLGGTLATTTSREQRGYRVHVTLPTREGA